MWQNSIQIDTNSKTQIVTIRNNSNCAKTQQLKLWQFSKIKVVTRLKKLKSKKNPTYGRQSISWPMRMVAPIPEILLVRQNSPKNDLFLCGNFTPFISKSFQIWDHFFPLLFHKNSKNLKSLDIWLREVGAKKRLNGVNKWKKINKKTFFAAAISHPLWAKVFKCETTSFHYFSQRIPNL